MPLFKWNNKYSIGNEEIDAQHKELFMILDRLYNSSYETDKLEDVYRILDELIDYSDYHFRSELHYMVEINFDGIGNQIAEHEFFTNEILRLKQSEEMNALELTKETIIFLGKWLLHHVTEEDRKIGRS